MDKSDFPVDAKFNWKALEENSNMDHPQQMLKDSKEFDEQLKQNEKNKRKIESILKISFQ